jgi:hypothetical protein
MGIIELAQIQLLAGNTANTPLLIENLKQVKKVIEDFSGLPTNFVVDQDDNTILYVIGGWETVDQHLKGFSGSAEQNKILDLIKEQMTITWQYYVHINYDNVPLQLSDTIGIGIYETIGPSTDAGKQELQKTLSEKFSGREHHFTRRFVGAWALPGGMTALDNPIWVQIGAFHDSADAKALHASDVEFFRKLGESHNVRCVPDPPLKIVKLLHL